ncbi:hypothetical protein [Aquihabitans sp. McL0605]|uniref:hypothetical protein n=1 Tax=Aquihabitans sp. McL0605 TaxID=3415671 RepID=UPI003CE7D88E
MGGLVVGVLGAMGAAVRSSDYHRRRSAVERVLVSAAERVKETPKVTCASPTSASYLAAARQAASAAGWSGSTVQITAITYWDGTTYGTTCYDNATNDLPLQRITIVVDHPGGGLHQQLEFVKGELDG